MTLAFRLAALIFTGIVVAALTYFLLWPPGAHTSGVQVGTAAGPTFSAARLTGQYISKNKAGSYRLTLAADGKAKLDFTDRKGRHSAYRGEIVEGRIIWRQSLNSKKWVDIAQPVDDSYTVEPPSTVITREGRFNRVQK